MKTFTIGRIYKEKGTRGNLSEVGGSFTCKTIERSKNDPEYPCIPEGWYVAKKYYSPANKCQVWLLQDVPGRTMIEFHIANWPHELLGCIAPGTEEAEQNGEPGVSHSGIAFHNFMVLTAEETEIAFEIKGV